MKNFENHEVDYVKIYEWIELEDKRQKRQKRQSVKKIKDQRIRILYQIMLRLMIINV